MGIKVHAKKSNPFKSLTLINQIKECLYVAKFKNLNFSSKLRGLRCHTLRFCDMQINRYEQILGSGIERKLTSIE